jgi:hypothetical protein
MYVVRRHVTGIAGVLCTAYGDERLKSSVKQTLFVIIQKVTCSGINFTPSLDLFNRMCKDEL